MSALKRLLRTPTGAMAFTLVLLLVLTAGLAPLLLTGAATDGDVFNSYASPSWSHLLGTDGLGRDLLARVLVATRLSLLLAFAAVVISAGLGILIGLGSSQLGPRARTVALRAIDLMTAFPSLLLAICIGTVISSSKLGIVLGVGIAGCFNYARLTSALALVISGQDYIVAARAGGVRRGRLVRRYLLPNAAETLIVATSVSVTNSIVALSGLSFLGLGVQAPDFDWGSMLTEGVSSIYLVPAAALGPATVIALSALSFGFLGEALARASNPMTDGGRRGGGAEPRPSEPVEAPRTLAATSSDEAPVLAVDGLRVEFPSADGSHAPVTLVRDVSFAVGPGERVGLVGESGSGKTMTALAIAHLTPYPGRVSGRIRHRGRDATALTGRARERFLATEVAVVFQDPMASLNPALRIGTQLTEGVRRHRGWSRREATAMAVTKLTDVQLGAAADQLRRHPRELSGGMRQRTMIAMGLMTEPALLIADEPTTALDVTIQAQIMDLLEATSRRIAVLLISHNLALVKQNTDRVLVMYAGRIVEEIATDRLAHARHPYTRALLSAVPDFAHDPAEPLLEIPGQAPDPRHRPGGCAFHPRCPVAVERCRVEEPGTAWFDLGERAACWRVGSDQ